MAKKRPAKTDYEQLGRMMANIYESGYIDRNQTYKMSFIKGILGGLGGVIGATIVVAILIWILSLLNFVPLVRTVVEPIRDTLQSDQQQ
jgi:hypothetical protein